LKPSNARVLKANAAYGQGGRLPGIHTSRTPRAANYPRAPVPGMPAETLDFTQWNPSDEINNVRWRLEVERDWQQRQEEKRKREVARQRREAIALAGEIKATKELQKKQMEEAAVGMQKDQAAHLEYLAQCERAQTAQQNDLLAWNRQEREEERLRLKEEAKAEKAELLRRMEEAKKVGKELDQDPAPMELSTPVCIVCPALYPAHTACAFDTKWASRGLKYRSKSWSPSRRSSAGWSRSIARPSR
jgi:hypothetical protein